MIIPSMTAWGSDSMMLRSMKAPGSPSSALQITYFTSPGCAAVIFHLVPVVKPAPPFPRSPASSTTRMISSGVMELSALSSAE